MNNVSIPLYRTFTNWLISVVVGSILLPVFSHLLGGNSTFKLEHYFNDDTIGLIGISMMASALCSLPALIVLVISHLLLNRNSSDMGNHQTAHNAIHIGVALLTFLVMGYGAGKRELDFVFAIAITYTSVGLVVWNITYLLYRKRKVVVKNSEDVLDSI